MKTMFSLLVLSLSAFGCANTTADTSNGSTLALTQKTEGADGGGRHHGHGRGHHGKPPEEVFAACDGKAKDAACEVKFGDKTINGSCKSPPNDANARAACIPAPPKEMVEACASKTEGAACNFTGHRGKDVAGTCAKGPHSTGTVVCRPNPPEELVKACSGLAEGAACSFKSPFNGQNEAGLCHKSKHAGDAILCRPERGHRGPPGANADGPDNAATPAGFAEE